MDLNTRLAEIRELQGREPLPDPGVIQGFESGSPPPPPMEDPDLPDYEDDDYPPEVESPLIPHKNPIRRNDTGEEFVARRETALVPGAGLMVVDGKASFRGFTVDLLDDERSAISAVVVLALKRVLEGHMEELRGAISVGITPEEKRAFAPKKRGRPRKDKA
ncbi:MAG: hypothetical protein ACRDGM_10780 [bacterium]